MLVGEEGVEPSIRHRQRILSPPCCNHNALQTKDLQDTSGVAPNSAPNFSSDNTRNPAHDAKSTAPNAENILEAIKGMSDAERGKLLLALLGLTDGHK